MSRPARVLIVLFLLTLSASAQQPTTKPLTPAPGAAERRISPAEADELFKSVDELTRFASRDTGLPIRSAVKRKLTSRDEVEKFLTTKLNEDEDAKRFERSELILKKFGMLPADFELRPLLIKLLREQIAGYYDPKEKTINLLDWLPLEAQKPVLAHEITHALQDQQIDLEQWMKLPESLDVQDTYNKGVRSDEISLARTSVAEGQAMVVLWDYLLSTYNKNLLDAPEMVAKAQDLSSSMQDGSALKQAPLVVRESLFFPYREGLGFTFEVLRAEGKQTAFSHMLKDPPINSHQVISPASYISGEAQPDPKMPDLGPALKGRYPKFDTGAVGEFDLRLLLKQFEVADAEKIASGWRGGMYYAGKRVEEPKAPADIALFYVSYWKNADAAMDFRKMYEKTILKRYPGAVANNGAWSTSVGDVRIEQRGATVFIAEGYEAKTAEALIQQVTVPQATPQTASKAEELSLPLVRWAAALRHPLKLD